MANTNNEEIKLLFSQSHNEQLRIAEDAEDEAQFLLLRELLEGLEYVTNSTTEGEALTSNQLAGYQILVMGAPKHNRDNPKRTELTSAEIEAVKQFVADGGGLLLISNAETMIDPPPSLNKLTAIANLKFNEYHNYPPTFLQVFLPHYITANVRRVRVGKIASLTVGDGASKLAFTKATREPVMACANVGRGRVVAIGDVDWLTDDLLNDDESNKKLVTNIFHWLAARNVVEIEEVVIPETVKLGQSATVVLQLRNSDAKARPQVESVLESDADALISEPARKSRSIPPDTTTRMQWTVRPQILGEQRLRLAVHIDGHTPLYFDNLPEIRCLAPGYFTLEIKDKAGNLETTFDTRDYFTVEGAFHWAAELEELPYRLELQLNDGVVERGHEQGNGVARWHLQATAPGSHKVVLNLAETGQSLPALITIRSSTQDRLAEIQAAYVYPLEAEIAERLRQVDESLSNIQIQRQPFKILRPEDFVQTVYKTEAGSWLQGVLIAAHREQWYNLDLLDVVLTYIAPTYLPNRGSFIPYDPGLASRLLELHPGQKRYLEYNLLCSEESEEIQVKQNIAAYLLHEKFGHGFFYMQTRLGQQLAILQRYGFPHNPEQKYEHYQKVAQLIEDSAIIVNEGFATWMELTFLAQLDREVRPAVGSRRIFLIQEATGLYKRERTSDFFQTFSPRFDSRYREGFEYLDFISRTFNLRCAIRVFLIATNIDLGISKNVQGELQFSFEPNEMENDLLRAKRPDWQSHLRLFMIAELLRKYHQEAKTLIRKQFCPLDCQKKNCPLEAFITEKLPWRAS
ncbi:MAG: DUF4350 domain-containing protein [Ardenticatenaceae bacterium]